jgi:hypothetical protein
MASDLGGCEPVAKGGDQRGGAGRRVELPAQGGLDFDQGDIADVAVADQQPAAAITTPAAAPAGQLERGVDSDVGDPLPGRAHAGMAHVWAGLP